MKKECRDSWLGFQLLSGVSTTVTTLGHKDTKNCVLKKKQVSMHYRSGTGGGYCQLLGIWQTTARQSLSVFSVSVCVQPAVIKSPSHATGSARTAVELFLLLVRRSGTHRPKTCGIRSVLRRVADSHWRHFYCRSTSMFSALEVCYENALYKLTFDIDIDIYMGARRYG